MHDNIRQRNADYMREFQRQRGVLFSSGGDISDAHVAAVTAASPAPSYYLDHEYARRRVSKLLKEGPEALAAAARSQSTRRRMMAELAVKTGQLMEQKGLCLSDALTSALMSEASSFFLSPKWALRIYYMITREHRLSGHRLRRRRLF